MNRIEIFKNFVEQPSTSVRKTLQNVIIFSIQNISFITIYNELLTNDFAFIRNFTITSFNILNI